MLLLWYEFHIIIAYISLIKGKCTLKHRLYAIKLLLESYNMENIMQG
ncbi:hypothetical protein [Helicobacter labetoulli]|nr:hypothetical protein [Helicobacter labetoulli]